MFLDEIGPGRFDDCRSWRGLKFRVDKHSASTISLAAGGGHPTQMNTDVFFICVHL